DDGARWVAGHPRRPSSSESSRLGRAPAPTLGRVSATLHVQGFGASHGARELFSDLSFTIAPGDVWGLVGANGAGKSTLLRALAGLDPTAHIEGRLTLAPPTASIGYLAQEPERVPGETVL